MQFITTKFFILPAPTDYVPRPQLLKKLEQVSAHKLTILSAPAGFGKTTLLSTWFRDATDKTTGNIKNDGNSTKVRPCWLSLDAEDNEPERFLEALFASLEDAGIPLAAAAAFLPIKDSANYLSALNALIHDLSNSQHEVVLALDDYHVIEDKEIHGLVRHLISHTPQSFHILISTRALPPLETGKLRASGQLLELGQADLKFTLVETREYLCHAQSLSLVEKDIVAIASKTEGWISGLKMAVLSMQNSEDPTAFVKAFTGSQRYIFDYLVEQALAQQPPDVKDFLLKTAIVESFNASLCDELTGSPGASQRIIAYLEQANLFIVPLDDERHWFRYHHLFAELLRSVLQQTLPDKVSTLHGFASAWYERNRMIPDAISHALAAGDVECAARMIAANVLLLVEQTELKTVLLRLDDLFSSGQAVESPWLRVAYAWVLVFSGEMKRARDILQSIVTSIPVLTDLRGKNRLDGNILAIQAYIEWFDGSYDGVAELARQAAEHLSASNSAAQALNLTTLANILLVSNQYQEALQVAQQAVDIGNVIEQPNIVMLAMSSLATAYHEMGHIGKSSETCEQALEQADAYRRKHGRILPGAAGIYATQVYNFHCQYDLERAFWYAKRALAFSEVWGQADTTIAASWAMAVILLARNDPKSALGILESAGRIAKRTSKRYTHLVKQFEGRIQLESGNLESARRIASELMGSDTGIKLTNFYILSDFSIKMLIADKEYKKALSGIDRILDHYKEHKSKYIIMALVLRAWVCQKMGDGKGAVSALEMALQSAEPEFYLLPFINAFQHLETPLRNIAAKGKYQRILERIFAIKQAKTPSQPGATEKDFRLHLENPIEPLTERELEILRLLNSHLPTPEIAEMLAVSVNTVRTHTKSIYAKLGVHSRSAAIDISKQLKLLA